MKLIRLRSIIGKCNSGQLFALLIVMTGMVVFANGIVSAQQGDGSDGGQVQTMNMGDESQISSEVQAMIDDSRSVYSAENATVRQSLEGTNIAAQEMIMLSTNLQIHDEESALKIQDAVKAQTQSMDKISSNIDKLDDRSNFAKFFIGADYGQVKEANLQIEANRLRIEELNQVQSQLQDPTDAAELLKQITVLEFQNTTVQDQVNQLSSGFSLLGWLFRLFNGM